MLSRSCLAVRARRTASGVTLALLSAACTDAPVQWTTSSSAAPPAGISHLAVTAEGEIVRDSVADLVERVTPPPGEMCAGSLRIARGGRTLYGVWWAPRPDSAVWLMSSRSADSGRTWRAPVPVDTLDQRKSGCHQAPPAIAADSTSGYLHVVYSLVAPEGPGLFFSHSMDGGSMFHSPVPIFYGERLGHMSVAADGDLVAVGFEDPNSVTPRVGLALSRTMGHIFEHRLLPVSNDNGAATHPMTAVRGNHVAIAWEQRPGTLDSSAPPALVVRAGVVH